MKFKIWYICSMLKNATVFFFLSLSGYAYAGAGACIEVYNVVPKITRFSKIETQNPLFNEAQAKQIGQVLRESPAFEKKIQAMLNPFKRYEMEALFFRQRNQKGDPSYFTLNRNADLLAEAELVVITKFPKGVSLTNVEFGYQNQHSKKVQNLGVIPGIMLDANGLPTRFLFYNQEQLEVFRAHYFGRPFSTKMRTAILDINTALFKYLETQPVALEKVAEFEKKRGWPEGTAKKIGLVYYSSEAVDLLVFGKKHGFDYADMASAGWLKPYVNKHGSISYRENYNDSIKIPFYDETNPSKIAFWRTRNLRSGAPKYLSWPKDRSLFEEAPLFEEFYNSWNLNKVKGKRIILTEGEFKCAIGELTTGVFHIGVPGIGQFYTSMLDKIVKAQPSEVVVLFDRDPIGKALLRLDEVTDSQRASYLIAKQLEAAGISVKVATLPDVYNGKKIGIDDLLLSHGTAPYTQALDQAVTADAYAKAFKIDVPLSLLTDRRNKIRRAVQKYDTANSSAAGFMSIDQRAIHIDLQTYLTHVEDALRQYMKVKYPERSQMLDPSDRFVVIKPGTTLDPVTIQTVEGNFDVSSPIIKISMTTSDVKNCTSLSCFSISRDSSQWSHLTEAEKFKALSAALGAIFPKDDYTFISSPVFEDRPHALLVIRKETRTPVAIVEQF
ncbi:MAG: hypothetical protein B7Y39_08000 [Bdellovibrio sp. 28-41-41]|nr:MAG: hypothetical protein B7Y39_08000 [Bdellovibrio sp. 28-41-41]